MRLIHTADWHFGAGFDKWPEPLAARRRQEREAAVRQVIDHALQERADYLVVAGDVCDFPESMPEGTQQALAELKDRGCVPVLFFTNAWHDGNRAWWAGASLGPRKGEPVHPKVAGRGHRLPHTVGFDNVVFTAFDHLPVLEEVSALQAFDVPRVLLLHTQDGVTAPRLDALRSVFSYIACGDCHAPTPIVADYAYYAGSPSFRDLASIDPGPRSFLDVEFDTHGQPSARVVEIETPLSAVLSFEDGSVTVTPDRWEQQQAVALADALRRLPPTYAYVKMVVPGAQQAQFARACDEEPLDGWLMHPWTDATRLLVRA